MKTLLFCLNTISQSPEKKNNGDSSVFHLASILSCSLLVNLHQEEKETEIESSSKSIKASVHRKPTPTPRTSSQMSLRSLQETRTGDVSPSRACPSCCDLIE